jgi:hypothetical protein
MIVSPLKVLNRSALAHSLLYCSFLIFTLIMTEIDPAELVEMDNMSHVAKGDATQTRDHAEKLMKQIRQHKLSATEIRILEMMTLPAESPPQRLGGDFGSAPSAVAHPKQILKLSYPQNAGWDLPVTDSVCFKFAHPLRSVLYSKGLAAGTSFSYAATYYYLLFNNAQINYPTTNYFSYTNGDMIHGNKLFLGKLGDSDQHRGILTSVGNRLRHDSNIAIPVGTTVEVNLYLLQGTKWEVVASQSFAGAGATISFTYLTTITGYYSFTTRQSVGAAFGSINFNVTVSGNGADTSTVNGASWAQLATPGVDSNLTDIQSARINAASLLYTNTSSNQYRGGNMAMRQLPPGANWGNFIDFNTVSSMNDTANINAIIGGYCFRKPTSPSDFETYAPTLSVPGFMASPSFLLSVGIGDSSFILYPKVSPLVIVTNISDANARLGFYTICDAIEFGTLNQLIDSHPDLDAVDVNLDRVLSVLATVPQCHTNDFHIGDIWDWITGKASDAWDWVTDNAASIIPAALPFVLGDNVDPKLMKIANSLPKPKKEKESKHKPPPAAPKKGAAKVNSRDPRLNVVRASPKPRSNIQRNPARGAANPPK